MENLSPILISIIGLVFLIMEFILGKTDWIPANSTIEAVIKVIVEVGKKFLPEETPKKK